jgi:hypothetical protein
MTQYRIDPRGVMLHAGGGRVGGILVDGWDCALRLPGGTQIWLAVRSEGAWVDECAVTRGVWVERP